MDGNGQHQQDEDSRARIERRLVTLIESRSSRLMRRDEKVEPVEALKDYTSTLQPERHGAEALAPLPPTYWLDTLHAFHQRRRQGRIGNGNGNAGEPGVPGHSNWIPIGPSVARHGQVSGRVARIAVAPGGSRIYVATALGGVWRSDDSGATWLTNEDSFDIDPTAFAATSLCCGAIAIDPNAPDRVYVGTGEGDVNDLLSSRFLSALPCYRGIGPVRSDDGGHSWVPEPVAAGSPPLAGAAFYALAVDPGDRENVVGATTAGLYRREPDGVGGYHWVQKRAGIHTAVIAGRSGATTTFYAAQRAGAVVSSPDGSAWVAAGAGFPAAGLARISLAMRGTDPSVVYALAENTATGHVDLYRLAGGAWSAVAMSAATFSEVGYTLGLAVDPNDATRLNFSTYTVSRGTVAPAGAGYSCTVTVIGGVHSDVHALTYSPGDSNTLWVGTDGGVYVSGNAAVAATTFTPRNTGLATMATEYFAQHASQPAVIFCGTQDNATMRYTGEEAWLQVTGGDGGACLVNWNNPYEAMAFQNGALLHSTDGASFPANVAPPGYVWTAGLMAPPLAIAPQSAAPADARIIALGADRPYLSPDFGASWTSLPNNNATDALGSKISAITFASPTKVYAATASGAVYRYDKALTWARTQIDNAAGGALPLAAIVKSIAVDPADASGNSIYITFGGSGDYRHVWHFNGAAWAQRSGPALGAATALLDVEHSAVVVDPAAATTLYVGCDVGVWTSTDGGANWSVFSDGLPDAAVLDLRVHQASRLLRASLHGRGLFELKLDAPAPGDVEIYIRDTDLDVGRTATVDYLPDPEHDGQVVVHWESPNIKVDVPTPAGYQTPTTAIDFYQFVDTINDGSGGVATMDPASGTVVNRVYVEVHNRGYFPAGTVNVMLLLCDASPHLPALPAGYAAHVQAGTAVGGAFTLVGVRTVSNLRAGFPQVVEFPLPSTMLPPPASLPGDSHYCLLALLHSPQDQFTAVQTDVDLLTVAERKVAQKNLHIVAFVGTPPPPSPWQWGAIQLHGARQESALTDLVIDTRGYGGRVGLVLPKTLALRDGLDKSLVGLAQEHGRDGKDMVEDWAERQRHDLRRLMAHGRYDFRKARAMLERLEETSGQPLLVAARDALAEVRGLELKPGATHTAFVAVQPPPHAKVGESFQFRVLQREHGSAEAVGGCTYSVQILAAHAPKPAHRHGGAEPAEIEAPVTNLVSAEG